MSATAPHGGTFGAQSDSGPRAGKPTPRTPAPGEPLASTDALAASREPTGIVLASGFFSIIPMPPLTTVDSSHTSRALRWLPALGAIFGLVAALVGAGALVLTTSQVLAAVLVVVVWQVLVGGMHLDGIADCFDGLAALGSRKDGRDAARALEIMRTPDTGAMGVAVIVLTIALQIGSLSAAPSLPALMALSVLAPASGRLAVLIASRPGVPAAHKGGFGALFHEVTPLSQAIAQTAVFAVLTTLLGWWAGGLWEAIALVVSFILALAFSLLWVHRLVTVFGGLTGDMLGALIETTSTAQALLGVLAISVPLWIMS